MKTLDMCFPELFDARIDSSCVMRGIAGCRLGGALEVGSRQKWDIAARKSNRLPIADRLLRLFVVLAPVQFVASKGSNNCRSTSRDVGVSPTVVSCSFGIVVFIPEGYRIFDNLSLVIFTPASRDASSTAYLW